MLCVGMPFSTLRIVFLSRAAKNGTLSLSVRGSWVSVLPDLSGSRQAPRVHTARDRSNPSRFLAVSPGSESHGALGLRGPREPCPLHRLSRGPAERGRRFQVVYGTTDHRLPQGATRADSARWLGVSQSPAQK